MKIKKLKISNFRNLNSVEIKFDDNCNFIVGENNIGKSNLLHLINTIFVRKSFMFEDFKSKDLPIEINMQLKLADQEIGHFEDLFDLDDYSLINISCIQSTPEDYIEFFHSESETYISPNLIRCANFIYYDSLRNPISEINFDRGKGVGRFLTNIVKKYFADKEVNAEDFIVKDKLDELLLGINSKLSKIKAFKDYNVNATIDNEIESMIPKLITLQDEKNESLSKTGYGVQFLLLITLSILDKLQNVIDRRNEQGVFENPENGEKSISLILGLDEPEIHLHPYLQRSLVKYLNKIIGNQNSDFQLLINELFGISNFIGQIIIVTHSPNIILNDFKQITRFFSKDENTKIISGCNIILGEQLEKHLFLHFPFIKEAFFSRCVIFVEGDSEYGSFPFFGEKDEIDFDEFGISVIQARGNSIIQLIQLAEHFGIPCIGIKDSDGDTSPTGIPNLFKTKLCDFEAELMHLVDKGQESVLESIIVEFDSEGINRKLDAGAINKRAYKKYHFIDSQITEGLRLSQIEKNDNSSLKAYYSTWFSINKSQVLGRLIGMKLEKDNIPRVYKNIIRRAKSLC